MKISKKIVSLGAALALVACLGASLAVADNADPNAFVASAADGAAACAECGATDGHADACSQYIAEEATLSVFDQLIAAGGVSDMYALALEQADAMSALSADEIDALFDRVDELDPSGASADTEAMVDLLVSLPGFISGAEKDEQEVGRFANIDNKSVEWGGTYNVIPTAGVKMPTGNVTITLVGTSTTWFDGAVTIPNGSHVTIKGSGTLRRGGVNVRELFNIHDGGSLTIIGASKDSVRIYGLDDKDLAEHGTMIRCDGDLTLENCMLYGNSSTYVRDSKVTATDNTADNFAGGAITLCDNNNNVSIKNCTFKDNTAKYGGGIYLCRTGSGTLVIENTVFDNCDATTSGGAIFFDGDPGSDASTPSGGYLNYTVTIKSTTIKNCDSGGCGSAIYMHKKGVASITMTDCTVENCVSETLSCGTIRCDGNSRYKLTVDNCLIQNNKSTGGHGAGIYWNALGEGASLVVKNSRILNNVASAQGGGMFVEGSSIVVTDTLIKGNKASMGGGIGIKTFADSSFTIADGVTGTSFNMTLGEGVIIEDNVATSKGAGISYNIVDGIPASGFVFNYTNDGAIIRNNVVSSEGTLSGAVSGVGGGVAIIDAMDANTYDANTYMKSGDISGNKAKDGGGLHITVGNFEMTGGSIQNHSIVGNGAGVYTTGGNVAIKGGYVQNNGAANGAIYVEAGNFTMSDGSVSNNSAVQNGGAVFVSGGNFTMSGGSLTSNEAAEGGAAYVTDGSFYMYGGDATSNTASNGGAVYVSGGNFNMISGTLLNNGTQSDGAVTEYGGAVYVDGGNITVGIKNCAGGDEGTNHTLGTHTDKSHPIIKSNKAQYGGAFAIRGENNSDGTAIKGIVEVYCSYIKGNEADNEGTGHNIFMDGGGITHYVNSAVIGEDANHEIVTIGGQLQVVKDGEIIEISLVYDPNAEAIDMQWKGKAPEGYHINLPYCPKDWQDAQAANDKAFVGWTEVPTDSTLASKVRDKDDYLPIGKAIEIVGDNENKMTFYAVWAPLHNAISYAYSLDGVSVVKANGLSDLGIDPTGEDDFSKYVYDNIGYDRGIPDPSKPGYDFAGWLVYADTNVISNWAADPVPAGTSSDNVERLDQIQQPSLWTGEIDRNFGDIVLVAVFEPSYGSLTISKEVQGGVDENQAFLFLISGNPDKEGMDNFTMEVALVGSQVVTVDQLPVGTYIVTEKSNWSWRYTPNTAVVAKDSAANATAGSASFKLTVDGESLTFTNERTNGKWLSGDDVKRNLLKTVN